MKQNLASNKIINSLLVLITLLHLSLSNLSFYAKHPDLFYFSRDGKIWEPLQLSDANFNVQRRHDKYEENSRDTEIIIKFYDINITLNRPGWIVKKAPGQTLHQIEKGDLIEFFATDKSTVSLDSLMIHEEKKKVDSFSSWNFLDYVNQEDNKDSDSTRIGLYEYTSDVDSNKLVDSTLSHQEILRQMAQDRKVDEVFVFKKSPLSFGEMLESKKDRDKLMRKLIREILKTIFIKKEWNTINDKQFKTAFRKKIQTIAEELTKQGYEHLEQHKDNFINTVPVMSKEEFAETFTKYMGQNELNILLMNPRGVYEDNDLYVPTQSKWEDKKKAFVTLLKHRLVLRLYLEFTDWAIHEGEFSMDPAKVLKSLNSLKPLANNKSKTIQNFVSETIRGIYKLLQIFIGPRWFSVYYWSSTIKDLDGILEDYVNWTFDNPVFVSLCVKDSLISRHDIGWSDNPRDTVEVDLLKDDGSRLLLV